MIAPFTPTPISVWDIYLYVMLHGGWASSLGFLVGLGLGLYKRGDWPERDEWLALCVSLFIPMFAIFWCEWRIRRFRYLLAESQRLDGEMAEIRARIEELKRQK